MKHGSITRGMAISLLAFTALAVGAQRLSAQADDFTDPESLLRGLYDAVSWAPGDSADWDHVRQFFLPQAVFCMRRTPMSMEVMSLDEFIAWFIDDVERMNMKERGFRETVERLELTLFGNTAHGFVVYQARFATPPDMPGQYGLDSFGMVNMNGRWWIASITNEVVTPSRPLPEGLEVNPPGS
jgi:hypothetical protein